MCWIECAGFTELLHDTQRMAHSMIGPLPPVDDFALARTAMHGTTLSNIKKKGPKQAASCSKGCTRNTCHYGRPLVVRKAAQCNATAIVMRWLRTLHGVELSYVVGRLIVGLYWRCLGYQ